MKEHDLREPRSRTGIASCIVHMMMVLSLILTVGQVSAQKKRIRLADFSELVNLSDPQMSPDGKMVVLVASRPNYEDNRNESEIVLVDIGSGNRRVLTSERPRVRHPRWSPDGDRLAFLAPGKDDKQQIFVMPFRGGDSKQITDAAMGVKSFSWRPNGREIAFVSQDEPEEKEGEEKHNKSFEVGDNVYLAKSAPSSSHVWLISSDGGTAQRLTSGAESVGTFLGSAVIWSPDGKNLAFVVQPKPHSGEFVNNFVKVLELETKISRTLASDPVKLLAGFSPDGRYLAYNRPVDPAPFFNPDAVYMRPVSGGDEVMLTPDLDRHLGGLWMPDGQSLLLMGPDQTRIALWLQPLKGKPRKLKTGNVDPTSTISIGATGALAFIGVEPQGPPELYSLPSVNSTLKRLTDFNAEIASRHLGTVESISWSGPDGFQENGVLIYPPEFDESKKYPLVLSIHGGPMGTSTEGFSAFRQMMAAKGWIIFSPNYRGSNNMGKKFQSAVVNDAGAGPGRDVMAGIAAVKAKGLVDDSRVAVSGWSYGGFMTTWLIGNYEGWAAAVAGAAVTDWFDWYNLADLNVVSGYGLGGSPWLNNNTEGYWKQSPITYAPNIRTPTLILCNTDDPRVPVTQSYKLYHALKDNGVPVQFIAYPIPGHFPQDPVHRRDVYSRWIQWIETHFEMSLRTSER